jgi:hypothetical protein
MASLLDKLQQSLGTVGGQATPGDETASVQKLLAAKKGIVGAGPGALGPRGLAAPEMAARATTQQQLSQVGQAAQLQATGISQAAEAQSEEQRQREQALAGQQQESSLRNRIQTESVLRGLEQGRAELGEKERQQGLEQVAANLRLQDARYVDNLRREGERARLQEDISFTEQLQKSVLEDNMAIQKLRIKNQSLLDVNDREFDKAMAKMGYSEAISAARDNLKADSQRALISGGAGLISTGIQAAGQYKSGGLSQGYQSYLDTVPQGERPMSYTAWQADQARAAQEAQGSQAAKGNLPATGPSRSYGGFA